MELAPGAREQAFIQRFYLYRNLTKPSEQLYISYAKVDSEGKAIRPSYLIGVIRKLFPKLELQNVEEIEARTDFYTKQAAIDYLIHGERDEAWYALAKYFCDGTKSEQDMTLRLLSASYACYENTPISRGVALALYGRKMEGSVTRLERFAACAYAHYLQYGLKLSERQTSSFESVDMGNIYHTALQRYSLKLEASQYDWFGVPDAEREAIAAEAMQEALENYPDMSIYASAESKHRMKRMMSIFQQTVWALTKQVRAGRFVPKEFEVRFSELDHMDALEYALSDDVSMKLTGRIDRVDTFDDGEKLCVKVIDYKSGNTSFDLIRIYQGLYRIAGTDIWTT
jgi:ATP-dependent helicase/nuclease subunit B